MVQLAHFLWYLGNRSTNFNQAFTKRTLSQCSKRRANRIGATKGITGVWEACQFSKKGHYYHSGTEMFTTPLVDLRFNSSLHHWIQNISVSQTGSDKPIESTQEGLQHQLPCKQTVLPWPIEWGVTDGVFRWYDLWHLTLTLSLHWESGTKRQAKNTGKALDKPQIKTCDC